MKEDQIRKKDQVGKRFFYKWSKRIPSIWKKEVIGYKFVKKIQENKKKCSVCQKTN